MSGARINASELTPEQRRQLGIQLPRAPRRFTKEHVRRYARELAGSRLFQLSELLAALRELEK